MPSDDAEWAQRLAETLRTYQAEDVAAVCDAIDTWLDGHDTLPEPLARLLVAWLRRLEAGARSGVAFVTEGGDAPEVPHAPADGAPDEVVAWCRTQFAEWGAVPSQAIERLLGVTADGLVARDQLAELTAVLWPILNRLDDPDAAALRRRLSTGEFDRDVTSQRAELEELRRWRREAAADE